jgi:flagellin-like hook-associated protein FlgL
MGALSETLTRLSTGLKINSGKDDPAGLIASELLKAQITGTSKAITNTQRANSLIGIADAALGSIGNLLNDIKGLTVEAASTGTMTPDQIAANQLQVDAALDSIDRIARQTNYTGKKLLDGSLDFRTAGMGGGISNVQIDSVNFGTASAVDVNVKIMENADYARLISNGTGVSVDTLFDVIGSRGSAAINVAAGSTNEEIANAINKYTDSTGVVAYVEGKAERGSMILSSAGSGNEIVITALEKGYDAGNYSFRITKGDTNDARIVQEAVDGKAGIVEITLTEAYERRYNDFAGMFNITVDTTDRKDADGNPIPTTAGTSVTMIQGTANKVVYNDKHADATTNVVNGKALKASVDVDGVDVTSALNGWTVAVNNNIAGSDDNSVKVDMTTKTLYINSNMDITSTDATDAIANALAAVVGGDAVANATTPTVTLSAIGITTENPLKNGDRFTFGGGAAEGEVVITYKEGATADDILALLNKAPNVTASLAGNTKGSDLVKNLPEGQTRVTASGLNADGTGVNAASRYSSGATSQQVIDLINSKLGDKFEAVALTGSGTGGRVSYQDAAVDYGDVNMGNALRFSGMDNGPIIRMTNLNSNGTKAIEQKLSVSIIHPSEADIKAGIHTPILEIKLATDKQGNSITTARDIVNLFNTLTPEQTMGVSVSQLYPPGVDPNGRIYGEDGCGKPFVLETCPNPIDGIVQPTGAPGPCGPQQGDLLLLGTNQKIVLDKAVGRIAGNNRPDITTLVAQSGPDAPNGLNGATLLNFGNTSALNGVTFGFTRDESKEGFDANTGTLMIFLDMQSTATPVAPDTAALQNAKLATAIDSAVAANWEAIRAFTQSTGDAVKLARNADGTLVTAVVMADALADATLAAAVGAPDGAGKTKISPTALESDTIIGTRGVSADDPVLKIIAKAAGTDWAGINIHFVNDTESGLTQYNEAYVGAYAADALLPELKVDFHKNEDGSQELIITANLGPTALSELNAGILAKALAANTEFSKNFTAEATQFGAGAAVDAGVAGSVLFNKDISKPSATTTGGYRIESAITGEGTKQATSSGIGMTGQSDANERLVIESLEVGSEQSVAINVIKGSLGIVDEYGYSSSYATGRDVVASINGNRAVARGNNISINTSTLSVSMNVAGGVGNTGFTITGGGALFQVGPDVVSQQQVRVGIGSMLTTALGGADGQLYMLKKGNVASLESNDEGRKLADRIVMQAISKVANTRGQLGAIQKGTLEPTLMVLQDSMVALTEANAMITNTDFAVESSNMTRLQLLVQAGAQALGIASQVPQYAGSLLR